MRLHDSLDDDRAQEVLRELLHHAPPADLAAKAHLYLGIIALDALKVDEARDEFQQAIGIDPTLEPPVNASPKTRALYLEARRKLAAASPEPPASVVVVPAPSPPPPAPAPPPPAPAPTVAVAEAPPPAPSHVPAYVVGGVGVACLAAGIVLGVVSNGPAAQATSPSAGEYAATAEADAQTASEERVAADVLFGAALAAGVTSVVLFFTEKPAARTEPSVSPGIAPVWGGAALFATGRF